LGGQAGWPYATACLTPQFEMRSFPCRTTAHGLISFVKTNNKKFIQMLECHIYNVFRQQRISIDTISLFLEFILFGKENRLLLSRWGEKYLFPQPEQVRKQNN
jgi:hypothetical protein